MDPASSSARPTVSVVIPVRNRPEAISECLRSLRSLDYPRDRLQIIVVDDASTDETPSVVGRFAGDHVRLIARDRHSGQSECRNAGAAEATGEIVAFIDSDCTADDGWLRDLVGDFAERSVVAVGGAVAAKDPTTWIERYEEVLSPLHKGSEAAEVVPGSGIESLASCNLLVRRDAFLAAGGFDRTLSFGEDTDLVWRLRGRGGAVRYRPGGVVYHDHPSRPGELFVRRVNYVTAQGIVLRRYPENQRVIHAPLGFVLAALLALTPFVWPWLGLAALAPVAIDVVASRSVLAVVRAYAAAFYRFLTHVGRYYALLAGIAGLVLASVWDGGVWLAVAAGASLVLPGVAEWIRKRPMLDPLSFVAASVVDALAVNVGAVRGCFVHRTLRPLGIRVKIHPTAASTVPSKRRIAGSAPAERGDA